MACRADRVTSRSTWMRRNFRRSCSCRPPPPSLRTTCQTSGTSARDRASSLLEHVVEVEAEVADRDAVRRPGPRPSARAAGTAGRGPSSTRPGTPHPAGCRRRREAAAAPSGGPCPAPARGRRPRWSPAPGGPARGSASRSAGPSAPHERQLGSAPGFSGCSLALTDGVEHDRRVLPRRSAGSGSGSPRWAAPQWRQKWSAAVRSCSSRSSSSLPPTMRSVRTTRLPPWPRRAAPRTRRRQPPRRPRAPCR